MDKNGYFYSFPIPKTFFAQGVFCGMKENTNVIKTKVTYTDTKVVDLNDYKVVFHYVGFMPDAYSIYTDEPVDSSTGVIFESGLKTLTESEATLGFDYVFSYSSESVVSVQIGIYDNEGTQISLTAPINIPLKRSHHTIMTGSFLMSQTSGGVSINPEYDGDHNLIFP